MKFTHMLTHEPVEEAIRFHESISVILPSLPSNRAAWSISPEASAADALDRMNANNIGALVVLSAQQLDGIIAREDIRDATPGKDLAETRVSEIMTRGVYYANPDMGIDECMVLMSSKRLRYLPVLEGSRVLSMISIDHILERVSRD